MKWFRRRAGAGSPSSQCVPRAALIAMIAVAALSPAVMGQELDARCYEQAYREYADAQRNYQRTVARLVTDRAPHLEDIADLLTEHQFSLSAATERAVLVTLRESPQSLRLDRRVNEWLDWSSADRRRLAARDTTYARLVQYADAVYAKVTAHPRLAEARAAAADHVLKSAEHEQAVAELVGLLNRVSTSCGRT